MNQSDELAAGIADCMKGGGKTVHVFGVGNPLRGDDAVGLHVAESLRRRLRGRSRGVKVHPQSANPELEVSAAASKGERVVLIDAVEARREPGAIVLARLSETKYGFFATHNIPLRLVPGVASNAGDTYIIGVQPESVEVGERLSEVVRMSKERLVAMIVDAVEAGV